MKLWSLAILVLFLVFLTILGVQIFSFKGRRSQAESEYNEIKTRVDAARLDWGKLKEELQYFSNPQNLEKELRSRFNYRYPDENLIIIVPRVTSSSATSTTSTTLSSSPQ